MFSCAAASSASLARFYMAPLVSLYTPPHLLVGPCVLMLCFCFTCSRVLPKFCSRRRMKWSSRQSNEIKRFSTFHAPLARGGGVGYGSGKILKFEAQKSAFLAHFGRWLCHNDPPSHTKKFSGILCRFTKSFIRSFLVQVFFLIDESIVQLLVINLSNVDFFWQRVH